jgi:L-threonylcarbamoyladenylate synthase
VPMEVTGGQNTIALRVPNHPVALSVLQAFGGGIAAPSANRFCRISPTLASHVEEELGDKVDMILDGGACQVGLESTIVDLSGEQPRLLRPGQISKSEIEEFLQVQLELPENNEQIHAPGAMEVHYAPEAHTILCSIEQIKKILDGEVFQHEYKLGVLAYGNELQHKTKWQIITMPIECNAYAHKLYSALRKLDDEWTDIILVQNPPQTEEWSAINDRLLKAARSFSEDSSKSGVKRGSVLE